MIHQSKFPIFHISRYNSDISFVSRTGQSKYYCCFQFRTLLLHFNHCYYQGKLARLNAAISESFQKTKEEAALLANKESDKVASNKTVLGQSGALKPSTSQKLSERAKEQVKNEGIDSQENQIPSKSSQPIILTSTSYSISLEEENQRSPTTTLKTKRLGSLNIDVDAPKQAVTTSATTGRVSKGKLCFGL